VLVFFFPFFDVWFVKEWMRLWYQAYGEFAKILHDERFQFRFLLQPDDMVLYSNLTMVHARESFSGARWVRGVYFDQNKVMSHLKSKFLH
jgi:alpha-ketoglutarate-dependent taurine dioxygenase